MASNLVWKVYSGRELVAATMYAEDAALVVGNTAEGRVKADGRIVWREGRETIPACDYVDRAAAVMTDRRRENFIARNAKYARVAVS